MRIISRLALASGGALLLSFVAVPLVQARQGTDDAVMGQTEEAESRPVDAKQKVEAAKTEAKQRLESVQLKADKKLDDTKLKICKNREKSISALMGRISDRGSRQLLLVDTVSSRIQQYVSGKQLAVANYDTLVASVVSAKANAHSANDAVKAAQPGFKCDDGDPIGAVDSFKALTKARDDAIKAYRDTVKALLLAVKTATVATTPSSKGGQ